MAIQQHPLPQDISAYRFRLIGDMTIKQFVSLGVGIVLAVIFYSSPLPFFFKYPLAFIFLLLGVGMAFVPVQGRSLDAWLVAFIHSIYSPTQYVWKQTALENISSDIAAPTSAANQQTAPQVSNPHMEISKGTVSANTSVSQPAPASPEVKAEANNPVTPVPAPETPAAVEVSVVTPPVSQPQSITPPSTPAVTTPPIEESAADLINPVEPPLATSQAPVPPSGSSQLPVPYTPTTPNTLVGLTITPDSKILDGVLVEIQKNGLTSRATKSNKLGQFMFARPLEDGLYQIFAEKEGYIFAPYTLELTGTIIRPLKIQAQ